MPRFFFHLSGPDENTRDREGVEFATMEEAFLDVHRAVLDISYEMLEDHRDPSRHRFEVSDAAGRPIFELAFAEVLRPATPARGASQARLFETIAARLRRNRELRDDLGEVVAQVADHLRRIQATLRTGPLELGHDK